jgi:hypothetical protein
VLVTTRLSRLAQLGEGMQLKKANKELSKAIFQQWRRAELGKASGRERKTKLIEG